MLTKKIKTRLSFLISIILIFLSFLIFIYFNLKQNILYFKTPSEIFMNNQIEENSMIRVGGMVKKDSIEIDIDQIRFVITDFKNELIVTYSGSVPNLFSEEKGVVAEGFLKDRKILNANRILAKHDENYMPPEVKKALEN